MRCRHAGRSDGCTLHRKAACTVLHAGLVESQTGKLSAAGRAWALGDGADAQEELEADAAFWGLATPSEPETTEIWADHLPAFEAFLAVCGQWRVCAVEKRIVAVALDYTAAKAGLELAGMTITPEVWAQVQTIETAALKAMREKIT